MIALGFGFKVFAEATGNPKKSVKQLGRFVGAFMMIVSLLGTFYSIWFALRFCPMTDKSSGGMWSKMCPFTGKMMTQDQTAAK